MALYEFEAIDASGRVRRGRMEAADQAELVAALQGQAQWPLRVRALDGDAGRIGPALGLLRWNRGPFAGDGLAQFTVQLSTLLAAAQPLDRALDLLQAMPGDEATRAVLRDVRARVMAGEPLSAALGRQTGVFPRLYVSMVRAGEASGSLAATLAELARYLERQAAVRARVVAALVYPMVLMAVVALALLFLVAYVLPQFSAMYASLEVDLPWFSRAVLALGSGLRSWGWLLLVLVVAAATVMAGRLRQATTRLAVDEWLLRRPRLGALLVRLDTARMARTLGTLLQSGVPLLDALALASEVVGNRALARDLASAVDEVRGGRSLASALAAGGRVPELAVHMVQVGEESGALPAMLLKVADSFERDSERATERLLAALVPAITVILALVVGAVVVAILVPLYDLTGAVG